MGMPVNGYPTASFPFLGSIDVMIPRRSSAIQSSLRPRSRAQAQTPAAGAATTNRKDPWSGGALRLHLGFASWAPPGRGCLEVYARDFPKRRDFFLYVDEFENFTTGSAAGRDSRPGCQVIPVVGRVRHRSEDRHTAGLAAAVGQAMVEHLAAPLLRPTTDHRPPITGHRSLVTDS